MAFLNLEHSARAYYADLVFYGAASMGLSLWLAWALPTGQRLAGLLLFALGTLIWTLLEYLLHRFVLHGFDPFRRWHQMHHDRPAARILAGPAPGGRRAERAVCVFAGPPRAAPPPPARALGPPL